MAISRARWTLIGLAGALAASMLLTSVGFYIAPSRAVHGWCCLCMCHAKDESKCSKMCLRLQHGKKIVELPEMEVCTKVCERYGVEQIFPEE